MRDKKKAPAYNSLIRKRANLLKRIGVNPFVLRASLRRHGNVCGRPNCSCKNPSNPKLHGPYDYLSHRYKDKTQSIFLTAKKLAYAREGIVNYRRLLGLIYRLSEINFRILRYHHRKLEDK